MPPGLPMTCMSNDSSRIQANVVRTRRFSSSARASLPVNKDAMWLKTLGGCQGLAGHSCGRGARLSSGSRRRYSFFSNVHKPIDNGHIS
eukprot:3457466-Pyramimonas_sp.AAC.1